MCLTKWRPSSAPSAAEHGAIMIVARNNASPAKLGRGGAQLDAKNQTLSGLANMLSHVLGASVVDQTGIQGEYDLVLELASGSRVRRCRRLTGARQAGGRRIPKGN